MSRRISKSQANVVGQGIERLRAGVVDGVLLVLVPFPIICVESVKQPHLSVSHIVASPKREISHWPLVAAYAHVFIFTPCITIPNQHGYASECPCGQPQCRHRMVRLEFLPGVPALSHSFNVITGTTSFANMASFPKSHPIQSQLSRKLCSRQYKKPMKID